MARTEAASLQNTISATTDNTKTSTLLYEQIDLRQHSPNPISLVPKRLAKGSGNETLTFPTPAGYHACIMVFSTGVRGRTSLAWE